MDRERIYFCIDLKSFYASVECVARGLDPLTTKLVVADAERSQKTICLAISPAMKALGIKNRCRLFQIPKGVEYITAKPRMRKYIDESARIYGVYLKYIAKEDMHVYSIDEVFIDATDYLHLYQLSPRELAQKITQDVLATTGITATCGIGTNLYLAKIALDILAKHDKDNIASLDEPRYKKVLWEHTPLTDFWRVGEGTAKRLARYGIFTMRDIASTKESILYQMFGVDAKLLIDHAWGRETTTIAQIKNYKPVHNSLSSGQVLSRGYDFEEGKLVIKEMMDMLCLDLVDKELVTDSVTLHIGYEDRFFKAPAHGSFSLPMATNSAKRMIQEVEQLYERLVDKDAQVRRINITCNRVTDAAYLQYDIFCDPIEFKKEQNIQKAVLAIKKKYGKNAILKGMNLEESATTMLRNCQIGGHRSGE